MTKPLVDVVAPGPLDASFNPDPREMWLVRMGDAPDEAAAVAIAWEHPEWLPAPFKEQNPRPVVAYSDEQPRADNGRFGEGSSVDTVAKLAEGDGWTINPVTGDVPTHGYVVAIDGHTGLDPTTGQPWTVEKYQANREEIVKGWVLKNAEALSEPHALQGGWVHDGKVFLDVVHVHDTEASGRASAVAHDQIAMYHLDTGEEIQIGGTGGIAAGATSLVVFTRWVT